MKIITLILTIAALIITGICITYIFTYEVRYFDSVIMSLAILIPNILLLVITESIKEKIYDIVMSIVIIIITYIVFESHGIEIFGHSSNMIGDPKTQAATSIFATLIFDLIIINLVNVISIVKINGDIKKAINKGYQKKQGEIAEKAYNLAQESQVSSISAKALKNA